MNLGTLKTCPTKFNRLLERYGQGDEGKVADFWCCDGDIA